uniref:Adenylate kinase 5 n=1 Tax=Xiphophorus couchianus TaxID=32473 RepID=A0A3B5MNF9_9TELE
MNTNDAKEYLARREIPQLFESLLTGLMYYRPDDPIDYLEGCLKKVRELGGTEKVRWDTFVGQERKSLPPLNGGQSRRSLFRNGEAAERHEFKVVKYASLDTKQESISVLQETPEKEQSFKSGVENVKKQDTSLPEEEGGQENFLKKEICREEPVISTTELVTEKKNISKSQKKVDQKEDKQTSKTKRIKKTPLLWKSFPEPDAICTPDLVVFLACTNSRLKERLQKRAEQQGRPDDNPKAIDRRLTNFKQNTIPLVKYFQERGLIVTLDADRDEEEVFCNISMTLDNKLFPSEEPVAGKTSFLFISSRCTEKKKPKVIFMIGGPGSGKALQCERLEERFGLRRVTLGELLCSEMQCHSERGRHLQDVLERGEKLPEVKVGKVPKNFTQAKVALL